MIQMKLMIIYLISVKLIFVEMMSLLSMFIKRIIPKLNETEVPSQYSCLLFCFVCLLLYPKFGETVYNGGTLALLLKNIKFSSWSLCCVLFSRLQSAKLYEFLMLIFFLFYLCVWLCFYSFCLALFRFSRQVIDHTVEIWFFVFVEKNSMAKLYSACIVCSEDLNIQKLNIKVLNI